MIVGIDVVQAVFPVEQVASRAAEEEVVGVAAADRVIAGEAPELVLPVVTGDHVALGRAPDVFDARPGRQPQ